MLKVVPLALIEAVIAAYSPPEPPPPPPPPAPTPAPTPAPQQQRHRGPGHRQADPVNRCRAYLKKVGPAVSGQRGHDRTFMAARLIWNDFGIDEAEGYPLLEEFNQSCDPNDRWSDKELQHKWDDAVEEGPGPKGRGFKLTEDRPGYTPRGTVPPRAGSPAGPAEAATATPDDERPNDEPNNPHRLAAGFLTAVSPLAGPPSYLLRNWRDGFYQYGHGDAGRGVYTLRPDSDFRADVSDWTRGEAVRLNLAALRAWKADPERNEDNPPKTFKVTTTLVTNIAQALSSMNVLPADVEAPAWIDGATGPDPTGILAMPNGLLVLEAAAAGRADCLMPHDHRFFTTNALPFPYDPAAPAPAEWLTFLKRLWPDDPDSIDALQEWFGYLLTADTSQQKILFLLGPKRSGKGTIIRVLREVLGAANIAGLTLSGLASEFGLQPLLGKTVAVFPDARLSGRIDATPIIEKLLAVSGEDAVSVNRKFLGALTVKLLTRFVILSNELPNLGDASGALASRLIILRLTESFYGREDIGLFDRLRTELPGILLWAIEGWKRMRQRGRLVQPASAEDVVQDMEDLASPVGAFLKDRCELGGGLRVEVAELYGEWKKWCEDHGKKEPGVLDMFGRNLRAAAPHVRKTRPRVGGGRTHVYTGVRLRPFSFEDDDERAEPSGTRSGGYTDPGDEPRGRRSFTNDDSGGLY